MIEGEDPQPREPAQRRDVGELVTHQLELNQARVPLSGLMSEIEVKLRSRFVRLVRLLSTPMSVSEVLR